MLSATSATKIIVHICVKMKYKSNDALLRYVSELGSGRIFAGKRSYFLFSWYFPKEPKRFHFICNTGSLVLNYDGTEQRDLRPLPKVMGTALTLDKMQVLRNPPAFMTDLKDAAATSCLSSLILPHCVSHRPWVCFPPWSIPAGLGPVSHTLSSSTLSWIGHFAFLLCSYIHPSTNQSE